MTKPALDPGQVRAELKRRAQTEGLVAAYEASLAICQDKTAPASAKSAAAGILMKLAGPDDDDSSGDDLHEMDGKQLARYAAELRGKAEAAEGRVRANKIEDGDGSDGLEVMRKARSADCELTFDVSRVSFRELHDVLQILKKD